MQVTIITTGWEEDVFPYITLAETFQQSGWQVGLILPHDTPQAMPESLDQIYPVPNAIRFYLTQVMRQDSTLIELIRQMRSLDLFILNQTLTLTYDACQNSDVIVSHVGASIYAQSIAEALNIPFFTSVPDIEVSQRYLPIAPEKSRFDFGTEYNMATGRVLGYVLWRMFEPSINYFRQNTLGLAPQSAIRYQEQGMRLQSTISATGNHIHEVETAWGENVFLTKPWATKGDNGTMQVVQVVQGSNSERM